METAHLAELIALEEGYWWHVAKRSLATELLLRHAPPPGCIVEGGIGAAGNLKAWRDQGYDVVGLDVMPQSVAHAKSLGLSSVHLHDLHEPWPVPPRTASAVVLLDVLEHLANPVVALEHAAAALRPGGQIIATVPAYPWLFSDWDERLGHFRRYTASMFRQHVKQAGLKVAMLRHWNSFTLPAACAIRLWRKLKPSKQGTEFPRVAPWTNGLLKQMARLENRVAQRMPIPCGLSLVGVVRP
jgi:SAM-dependent methyltransferase